MKIKTLIIIYRICSCLLLSIVSLTAQATVRYVKAFSSGLADGSSWANASADLQLMINNSAANDEVWVAAGTYNPIRRADALGTISIGDRDNAFVLKTSVKIYAGFVGTENSLSQRNYVANVTILSGDIGVINNVADNCYHVVIGAGADNTALLDGFSITKGKANGIVLITVNGIPIEQGKGAGICLFSSSPSISHCNLVENAASSAGGGIYNNASSPLIAHCSFSANTAVNGAGVSNQNASTAIINDVTFAGNLASQAGGGIHNEASSPQISDCIFKENHAKYGAGLYGTNSSGATVTNSSFTGNVASGGGGGICNVQFEVTITNCLLSGNTAVDFGGGIFNSGWAGSLSIINCTVASNRASQYGGGIYNTSSNPAIKNCIVWGNTAVTDGNAIYNLSSTPVVSNSIVEGGYTGAGNINADPIFIFPRPAGLAPTTLGNYRLQACSPAINMGSNAAIAGYNVDLDSNTRIVFSKVDMGAYERQTINGYIITPAAGVVFVNKASAGGNGNSWPNAVKELADALQAAKYDTNIKEIWVAKGAYFPLYDAASLSCSPADSRDKAFVLVNNVKVYGGFFGNEISLSQRNFLTNVTTLSGDIGTLNNITDNCYHVVVSAGLVNDAALDGFTITKGNGNGNASVTVNGFTVDQLRGGGMYIRSSAPFIMNCSFLDNNATNGGGMEIMSSAPVITYCSFKGNTASYGGGIIIGDVFGSSSPVISSCFFSDNEVSLYGGGIYINSFPSLVNCVFSGNKAVSGGGVFAYSFSSASIINCSIAGNKSTGNGGGIFNSGAATTTIFNCISWGNVADGGSGHAIYDPSGSGSVTYCLVEGGFPGTGNITANPSFVSPQPAAAAPTAAGDYHILPCSPAINGGSNTVIAGFNTDLDINTRIAYGTVDMGAYEVQSTTVFNITPTAGGRVYVNKAQPPGGNGDSWANAVKELADALSAAKYDTGIEEIWVAKGTYYPLYNAADLGCIPTDPRDKSFVLVNNVKVYGGFAGIETTLTERNYTANPTTLDGNIGLATSIDNAYHVVISAGAVGTAALDGFTIVNGNANGTGMQDINTVPVNRDYGAGMAIFASSPIIENCIFSTNKGATYGGGVANVSPFSIPVISNCRFISNTAVYGAGMSNSYSSPALNRCSFSGNTASANGGGMYNDNSNISLLNSLISGNKAVSGAGMANAYSAPTITNCTIAINQATTSGGGMNNFTSTPVIKNSILWGNTANAVANAMASSSGTPTVSYSLVEGGHAGTGNIHLNPLFVNQPAVAAPTLSGDYHLQTCSPAINQGNNGSITGVDLDSNPRIALLKIDMGAYEVQTSTVFSITGNAGIVYVDKTKPGGDGSSWANAVKELAEALKAAKYNSAITEIWVAKGTYYPLYDAATMGCTPADDRDKSFMLVNDVKLYGGFAGTETMLSERNFLTNVTILSGNIGATNTPADNCYHVVGSSGPVADAVLDGFSIIAGNANVASTSTINSYVIWRDHGAGMFNSHTSPKVSNCRFFGNNATNGGGFYNDYASPQVTGCSFYSNSASNEGGAMFTTYTSPASPAIVNCNFGSNNSIGAGGAISTRFASPSIMKCSFFQNTSQMTGGAVYNESSSTYIDSSTFNENYALFFGGAIYNNENSTPSISNSLFTANSAGNDGGAVSVRYASTTISSCTFRLNGAIRNGGAIMIDNISTSILKNCNIYGNRANGGGGICTQYNATPTLINCLISGNKANADGGGIMIFGSTPSIINCSIASNAALNGGGIFNYTSSPVIKNSIVWGNTAGGVPNAILNWEASSVPSVNYSIVEGGYVGTGNSNLNPSFILQQPATAAPAISGNYRVQPCSPAVNAGNNPGTTTPDLDGNPRIVYTTVDMGAYEVQTSPALNITPAGGIVYVDKTKPGGIGNSWANAVKELADALKAAKYNAGITQIWVAKGTYYPLYDAVSWTCGPLDSRDKAFLMVSGVSLFGGFDGTETLLSQRNHLTNPTILSGDIGTANDNTDNSYHVVISSGSVGGASFDGFTITKGNANQISPVTINGNSVARYAGAGMQITSSSPIILNCNFSGNAASYGGGLQNTSSSPTIRNSIFTGNTASTDGGGMFNYASSPSLANCVFSGNLAAVNGGGLGGFTASPTLVNCTIASNRASARGGAVYNDGSAVIRNSILWGNTAVTAGNNIFNGSGTAAATYSLVEAGYTGSGNVNVNPLFANPRLASEAATTLGDYRLQVCSPAINVGNNASVPAAVTTDLDVNPRIAYTTVDMGAYEVQLIDATQNTWKGISTTWADIQNWCGGVIPTAATNVLIPAGLANYPVISSAAAVKNILLANNTSITLNSAGSININGTYTNNGSTINNNGSWIMAGSAPSQSFPGSLASITAMNNLEINNSSGISFNKPFSIKGTLTATAGIVNLNNVDITLLSDINGTASIAPVQAAASFSYTGTGAFIIERFIATANSTVYPNHKKSWQFLAVPVNDAVPQTINSAWQEGNAPGVPGTAGLGTNITNNVAGTGGFDLVTGAGPSMKTFDAGAGTWIGISGTNIPHYNKKGYMLFVRGDRYVTAYNANATPTTLRTRGKIFQPTINPPPSTSIGANKFESVGNPYASAIDFKNTAGVTRTGNVQDVFYVWDPRLGGAYGYGAYQVFTKNVSDADYTVSPGGGSYPAAGGTHSIIESGQAFFVRAVAGGGTIGFNEAAKVDGSRLVTKPPITVGDKQIRTLLYDVDAGGSRTLLDGVLSQFQKNYSDAVDILDALKLSNATENLGIFQNGELLSVERRSNIRQADTIHYNLGQLRVQQYQLEIIPENIARPGLEAILVDRYLLTRYPVSLRDTTRISFNIENIPGSYAPDRFILVFKPGRLITASIILRINEAAEPALVWNNQENFTVYEVQGSADGRNFTTIYTQQADKIDNILYRPGNSVKDDFYYYRVLGLANGSDSIYSNIVKMETEKIISVFPNPVTGKTIHLVFRNQPAGNYNIQLINLAGQKLKEEIITVAGSFFEIKLPVAAVLPGTYYLNIKSGQGKNVQKKIIIL